MLRKIFFAALFIIASTFSFKSHAATPVVTNQPAPAKTATTSARININTADQKTLEELPGVGPTIAREIIAARSFRTVADLEKIEGIGPARFALLKDKVTVGGRTAPSGNATNRITAGSTARYSTNESSIKRSAQSIASGKINLNTASKDALDSLPGIGPVKAQAIIDARPFKTVQDVMRVKGIKEGEFNKIKDRISVE